MSFTAFTGHLIPLPGSTCSYIYHRPIDLCHAIAFFKKTYNSLRSFAATNTISARSSQTTLDAYCDAAAAAENPLPPPKEEEDEEEEGIETVKAAAAPTVLNASSPSPKTRPSRPPCDPPIPLQRRRPPSVRLSLTLDLSVVNLGNSARCRLGDAAKGIDGGRTRAIVDGSLGTAASSGVVSPLPSLSQRLVNNY